MIFFFILILLPYKSLLLSSYNTLRFLCINYTTNPSKRYANYQKVVIIREFFRQSVPFHVLFAFGLNQ